MQFKDFEIDERHCLGGIFGTKVYLGRERNNNGRSVAIKKISLEKYNLKLIINETSALKALTVCKNPNLIEYLGFYLDESQSHLFQVFEYCSDGNLRSILNHLKNTNKKLEILNVIDIGR